MLASSPPPPLRLLTLSLQHVLVMYAGAVAVCRRGLTFDPANVRLLRELAVQQERVEDWIGAEVDGNFDGVNIRFTSPNGQPGLDAATFATAAGPVRI